MLEEFNNNNSHSYLEQISLLQIVYKPLIILNSNISREFNNNLYNYLY